jgi:hypothetical protein
MSNEFEDLSLQKFSYHGLKRWESLALLPWIVDLHSILEWSGDTRTVSCRVGLSPRSIGMFDISRKVMLYYVAWWQVVFMGLKCWLAQRLTPPTCLLSAIFLSLAPESTSLTEAPKSIGRPHALTAMPLKSTSWGLLPWRWFTELQSNCAVQLTRWISTIHRKTHVGDRIFTSVL